MRTLAGLTHIALYALLIVLPLMGWANASSRDWPVALFARIPLPYLSSPGSRFGHALGDWHANLAWVLLALVVLHVCAAIYHHLVLRDGTLIRMLPTSRDSKSTS
ncbi:cytochrome B561 (plasmid) [Caballeronia insecticola]|uniref:Cytochrome B561 n=2 Tax=Caballeronia insecticola TaxID=758793 RepID=R4X3R4_9BURK|nr:cytochrome B561 [Caballeronia insecticola]